MKNVLINFINKNRINFIVITIIFCIGITIGIFLINIATDTQKNEINKYIDNLICNIKNQDKIDLIQLQIISIKNNLFFIVLVWLLGCTIIGGPIIYFAILYKGVTIGYTISALIAVLGIKIGTIISFLSLLPQNVIFLPAFFLISENGIRLYNGIYKRCVNLREEFIRHTIFMLISSGMALISSFIEVYCSTNLLLLFISKVLN